MINVAKQVFYWQNGAEEELLNATIMIDNKRFLAGLFFCHLCIEKILKAIIVKISTEHPLRTHNLLWLAEKAGIVFNETQLNLISVLQVYQLEGRYPDSYPDAPPVQQVQKYYEETKNIHQWLKAIL